MLELDLDFQFKESNLELYRSVIETNTISNINIAKIIIENCLKGKENVIFYLFHLS